MPISRLYVCAHVTVCAGKHVCFTFNVCVCVCIRANWSAQLSAVHSLSLVAKKTLAHTHAHTRTHAYTLAGCLIDSLIPLNSFPLKLKKVTSAPKVHPL